MSLDVAHRARLAVVETVTELRQRIAAARAQGARIGLVPTMGALHDGHLSLMQAARQECDFVVVSIFVNPTQFGPREDFRRYPRDLNRDCHLCEQTNVDLVFHPSVTEVYPSGFCTFTEVEGLSSVLEGKFRPGHFRGVTTVVLKLFEMVGADVAYFGQKDYQQQTIIRRMCVDLNLPIEIRVCPTVREPDGLALSSRNVYLNADERKSALVLSRSLNLARELLSAGETDLNRVRREMLALLDSTPFVAPDYATLIHPDSLEEVARPLARLVAVVAARVGTTRLIDNLIIDGATTTTASGTTPVF